MVSDLSYRSVSGETLGITLRQPGRPRALIVLVHGGGFRGGARSDMTVWRDMFTPSQDVIDVHDEVWIPG